MTPSTENLSPQARRQEALRVATQMFGQNPDWVTFFREVLGVEGVARRLFASQEDYVNFEKSDEFVQIQNMVATLRTRSGGTPESQEPTRVITVRLPKSLHEALRAEAHDHKTSMNKLCISKLLQVLAESEAAAAAATAATSAANAAVNRASNSSLAGSSSSASSNGRPAYAGSSTPGITSTPISGSSSYGNGSSNGGYSSGY